ncbi:MAG: glycosyltransferase [Solirubrobacteraceae bacterium]|nr:glycosyltransferase [Solirubrobacteraceae bacterium]
MVVTHDRRELLRECLGRLRAQTRPADRIVVVDNASTDGTAAMLADEFADVETLRSEDNLGGAGGFHLGMRHAHDAGFEWIWVLDDDTFAEPDALAALLAGAERAPAGRPTWLLGSRVNWTDGRPHPMNGPWLRRWDPATVSVAVAHRLLPLRHSTFVSMAVHRDAIDRHGLPHAHYFIWNDDFEFSGRLLRDDGAGYLVPDSVVTHATARPHSTVTGDRDRFYWALRNTVLMLRDGRAQHPVEMALSVVVTARWIVQYLRRWSDPRALRVILRGLRDGVRHPVR